MLRGSCPADQLGQFLGRAAVLDPAELRLGKTEPIADYFLRQRPRVPRMSAVSEDDPAHMPGGERVAHLVGIPELARHARRPQ